MKYKNTLKPLILILMLMLMSTYSITSQAKIYQWKDEQGRIHYDSNGANVKRQEFKSGNRVQSILWRSKKVTFHKSKKSTNKQQQIHQKNLRKQCVKTVKRMKKIKLSIKDQIAYLENQLTPDIIA